MHRHDPVERQRLDRRPVQPLPLRLRRLPVRPLRPPGPVGRELFSNRACCRTRRPARCSTCFPTSWPLGTRRWFVTALLIAAVRLSVLFAVGWRDRLAARRAVVRLGLPLRPQSADRQPGLPYVGWMLLAHAFLPPAPYGSLAARGRADPGGGWLMPQRIFAVAWILMALGYTLQRLHEAGQPVVAGRHGAAPRAREPAGPPDPIRDDAALPAAGRAAPRDLGAAWRWNSASRRWRCSAGCAPGCGCRCC